MTNHLYIALKHIQNCDKQEVASGRYQVNKITVQDTEAIQITHLKFMGKRKFVTCKWIPQNNALFVCAEAGEIPEEIIFIIRSIKRLKMKIEYIVSSNNTDITSQFMKYL
jgi:hypothetical protein